MARQNATPDSADSITSVWTCEAVVHDGRVHGPQSLVRRTLGELEALVHLLVGRGVRLDLPESLLDVPLNLVQGASRRGIHPVAELLLPLSRTRLEQGRTVSSQGIRTRLIRLDRMRSERLALHTIRNPSPQKN